MASHRRAQGGLEYLVTYGWAVFILIVIVAVLWSMGVFNSVSFAGPAISAGGFSSFKPIDHKVTTTSATVLLANVVSRQATLNSATVGRQDDVADTTCNTGLPLTVSANGNFSISCTSIPQGTDARSGAAYDLIVTLSFSDGVTGVAHTDIGYIKGTVN